MEHRYGSDRERSVNKGPGWDTFKRYIEERNTGIDVNHILERVPLKRDPIVSCGIIEFAIKPNKDGRLCAFYHVFRRRNTVEYDTLIRGHGQKNQLFDLISLLSRDERDRILNHTWQQIWDDYWLDHTVSAYTTLQANSKSRFPEIKELVEKLDKELPCRITRRPYIFPKGKPEKGETGLEAALREAREETGTSFSTGYLYFNSPVVQHYRGSDNCQYSDYYYVWRQDDLIVCPIQKLCDKIDTSKDRAESIPLAKGPSVSLESSDSLSPRKTSNSPPEGVSNQVLDSETRLLILKMLPSVLPIVDRYYNNEKREFRSPRLRDETISHELESDAWIEIPIFTSARERLEWMNSVNSFQEFGIFRRHFMAIMEIHQHLVGGGA
jgi:hypothetical protein